MSLEKNIKPDEFNRVCRSARLLEIKPGMPVWANPDKSQGIELYNGTIKSFQVENFERNYETAITDPKINLVLGTFEEKVKPEPKPEPVKELTQQSTPDNILQGAQLINSIPDILEEKRIMTNQDIAAWQKLTVFDRLLLVQKTPKNLIRKRRGYLKSSSAGKDKKSLTDDDYVMFNYVAVDAYKLAANMVFLFKGSLVIEETKYFEPTLTVVLRGYYQVHIDGETIRQTGVGSGICKGAMDWGDAIKTAKSECLKNALEAWGFFRDVKGTVGEVE